MIEGVYERNKYFHDVIRKATSMVCASGYNHKVAQGFERLWPEDGAKKSGQIPEAAMEQLRKLRKVEAQNKALEKINQNG